MTANFHIPLAPEQQAVAVELQGALVALLELLDEGAPAGRRG